MTTRFCLASFVLILHALGATSVAADKPTSDTLDVLGVKIHYLVQGNGEPVVLIHGLYSSAAINWVFPGTMAALATDHQVIALDLPGHGQSDKPENDDAYGTQLVQDVLVLMDHLQIKKAHIVGYSMGGMIAMKFVTDHSDRVMSCALGGMGWLRDGSGLQKFWEKIPERRGQRTPSACVRSFGKLAVTRDEIKAVTVPLEMLVGDRDPCKELYVDPLHEVRKDWPVIEIKDAGHLNCVMKEQFKDELAKWIAGHSQHK